MTIKFRKNNEPMGNSPESQVASDDNWSPDYSDLVKKLTQSYKDGNKSDPIDSLYQAALDLANQQSSDGKPHGDWEVTEMVDDNFKNLINEAKNNNDFMSINPNLTEQVSQIDSAKNATEEPVSAFEMLFDPSSGQKYRDINIKPKTGSTIANDIGNAINGFNYHAFGKPVASLLDVITGGNSSKVISPDAAMAVPSAAEDVVASIGGAIASGPAAPAGAVGAAAGKNALENADLISKAVSGIDPISGNELTDDEKTQAGIEAGVNVGLGSLAGAGGAGMLKPGAKMATSAFTKNAHKIPASINKVGNFISGHPKLEQSIKSILPQGASVISGSPFTAVPTSISSNFTNKLLGRALPEATEVFDEEVLNKLISNGFKGWGAGREVMDNGKRKFTQDFLAKLFNTAKVAGKSSGQDTNQDVRSNLDYLKKSKGRTNDTRWIVSQLTRGNE